MTSEPEHLPAAGVSLAFGELRAELAPRVGGSIASFYSVRGAARIDWLRPASAAALARANPLGMGSFPLLPWCNRIRDGQATALSRRIAIARNHPVDPDAVHPLHGIGWLRPWQVLDSDPAGARLGLRFEADLQWPWRFEAEQQLRLGPLGLACRITLRNTDTTAMPAGIGHHPYFPHRPGTRVRTTTEAMWRSDPQLLPTSLARAPDAAEVRSLARGALLAGLKLDNNFTGWERRATFDWPSIGCTLELTATSPLDFFVLYSPPGLDHFCAEPVSQCTDAINLAADHPVRDIGGTLLEPGQSLEAQWALVPSWPSSTLAPAPAPVPVPKGQE